MQCILVATDLSSGAHHALGRAYRLVRQSNAELHILHAAASDLAIDDVSAIRRWLHDKAESFAEAPPLIELDLSVHVKRGKAASVILKEADRLKPDLIILGAHGEPRLRDVLFGTTAARVARDAEQPVLVVQNDYRRRYARVMAALEEDRAEDVLRLACGVASMHELYVVHAHGSATQSLFGYGDVLEDVRADQKARIEQVLASMPELEDARPRVHSIVKEGEVMSVLMHEWEKVKPDLVVIGTHGRHGYAKLIEPSVAEAVLLGCPGDILVMPGRADVAKAA